MFDFLQPFDEKSNFIILKVKVSANAKQSKIGKIENDVHQKPTLKLYIKEIAMDGKANMGIIELLSKFFETAKSNIEITHGLHNNFKSIKIIGEAEHLKKLFWSKIQ